MIEPEFMREDKIESKINLKNINTYLQDNKIKKLYTNVIFIQNLI